MNWKIKQQTRLRIRKEQSEESHAQYVVEMYVMEMLCENLSSPDFNKLVNSVPNLSRVINRRRVNGHSPLTLAILNGLYDAMITLLQAGAFPDGVDGENMPLKITALISDQSVAVPMRLALLWYSTGDQSCGGRSGDEYRAAPIILASTLRMDSRRLSYFLAMSNEWITEGSLQRLKCISWLEDFVPTVLANIIVAYATDIAPNFYELYGIYEERFRKVCEIESNTTKVLRFVDTALPASARLCGPTSNV